MKYSFTCAPDGKVISAEAKDDQEALTKLVAESKKHFQKHHKGQTLMSDEESRKFIPTVWKKG
jgi:hypothetical protein